MAFWSDAGLEPKRKHKFLLTVGTLPQLLVKSVNKPNADIAVGEHKFLGNTYKFPGGIKWNDVTATFVDTENDNIVQKIMGYMKTAGNQNPNVKGAALAGGAGTEPLQLIDKSGAVSALGKNVLIEQIDELGATVEKWTLYNAWISKLDFGDLAYESDNALSEYKITLVYDWAEVETYNTIQERETGQIGRNNPRPPPTTTA
jgi:hypothetical protein